MNAFSVLKYGIRGIEEYDFELAHILAIFPCLMNKMIVNLLKGTLFESISAVEGYCHFLRLFIRILEDYPILQKIIDLNVDKVIKDSTKRNKQTLGDMGEFIILLSFSTSGLKNKEWWETLIFEYIARQFFWVIQKIENNEGLFVADKKNIVSYTSFFTKMSKKHCDEFFLASKVSNNLLLFNFCAASNFLFNRKQFVQEIENNYGVVPEEVVKNFIKDINQLKNNINSYEDLFQFIDVGYLSKNLYSLQMVFKTAWEISMENKYNKNYK